MADLVTLAMQSPRFDLLTTVASCLFLPAIGLYALLSARLASGESLAIAQRRFFVCLIVTTIVTLRTVIACDDAWLIHTGTLAVMIVGALAIPGHHEATAAV